MNTSAINKENQFVALVFYNMILKSHCCFSIIYHFTLHYSKQIFPIFFLYGLSSSRNKPPNHHY